MALTAELRCGVSRGTGVARIVWAPEEEHGRVCPPRQPGLRTRSYSNHIHGVRLVTGGAKHYRRVVVHAWLDKETVAFHKAARHGARHRNLSIRLDAVPTGPANATTYSCGQAHGVIVQIAAGSPWPVSKHRGDTGVCAIRC